MFPMQNVISLKVEFQGWNQKIAKYIESDENWQVWESIEKNTGRKNQKNVRKITFFLKKIKFTQKKYFFFAYIF